MKIKKSIIIASVVVVLIAAGISVYAITQKDSTKFEVPVNDSSEPLNALNTINTPTGIYPEETQIHVPFGDPIAVEKASDEDNPLCELGLICYKDEYGSKYYYKDYTLIGAFRPSTVPFEPNGEITSGEALEIGRSFLLEMYGLDETKGEFELTELARESFKINFVRYAGPWLIGDQISVNISPEGRIESWHVEGQRNDIDINGASSVSYNDLKEYVRNNIDPDAVIPEGEAVIAIVVQDNEKGTCFSLAYEINGIMYSARIPISDIIE